MSVSVTSVCVVVVVCGLWFVEEKGEVDRKRDLAQLKFGQ